MTLGCGRLSAFRRVALPLALPGVAASAIFVFVTTWNEVFAAALLTFEPDAPRADAGRARHVTAAVPSRGRLLPARARARRDLPHPAVPADDLGARRSMSRKGLHG